MDISQMAQEVTRFLLPFMPFLLKMGEASASEAAKKFGAAAWDKAQSLWSKLRPHAEAQPAAKEALQDSADMPGDTDAEAALRLQIKKLLSNNPTLADEINELWAKTRDVGSSVIASGERSVAIGGTASNSSIITGDHNRLRVDKE
ncbi:MAG TPA: hypothetical protein VJ183_20130 [Chloroflexia bacterium]|nr:hypothetical protein [Chloroflexia bacterium]